MSPFTLTPTTDSITSRQCAIDFCRRQVNRKVDALVLEAGLLDRTYCADGSSDHYITTAQQFIAAHRQPARVFTPPASTASLKPPRSLMLRTHWSESSINA
jgi:hypothetical protein